MKFGIQEPSFKPRCCDEPSKWVIISPSLYYFYCEKCKKEVPPVEAGTATKKYGEEPDKLPAGSKYLSAIHGNEGID